MNGRRRLTILLALLLLAAPTGCQRKPRFQPLKADSTAAVVDSASIRMRQVQNLWEGGAAPDDAAALSAHVLWDRLRTRPPSEWKARGAALLDSLGIGYESVGARCALMVNFFQRSDPGAGSWPYLYWCADPEPLYQAMDGRGLGLVDLVTRGFEGPGRASTEAARGVAALFARRSGGGQQPLLMVWSVPPAGRRWNLVQTLGPDSLGGTGTAEFESPTDTTIDLVVRTYRTPAHFEECATCPHVYGVHRFRWGDETFQRAEDTDVPSPYSTFVAFIEALSDNDYGAAIAQVTQPGLVEQARAFEWGRQRGAWRIAPATDETPEQMTFFRGPQEAYRIEFQRSGRQWLIAGFEQVARTLE
jgi:hypothetical protein